MYKFRKIENLIGKYSELENQEIYFSDVASLNDPMEGFRDLYWHGDIIVWTNFFKHYLLCLENVCMRAYLSPDEQLFSKIDIQVYIDETKLPTETYKQIFQKICDRFFNTVGVNEYIKVIASRPSPIRRDEIFVHLKSIHLLAIHSIIDIHVTEGFTSAPSIPFPDMTKSLIKITNVWTELNKKNRDDQEKMQAIFTIEKEIMRELDLIKGYDISDAPENQRKWFIFSEFPNAYLDQIENLLYPEAYVSCFMKNCTNAAVWGHYGDSHKGVCLKFKTKTLQEQQTIELNCINGWNSMQGQEAKPSYRYSQFKFNKIQYQNKFLSIDFFKSIGRLPMPQLISQWYTDSSGNISQCSIDTTTEKAEQEWRKQYWEKFQPSFLIKLKDWEYENEYRLILQSILDSYKNKENRKLKYKFDDLESIIFGARTKTEDKIKIIKIIESKCKINNRNDFSFYQAYYSPATGSMKISKLEFVKF